jgi:NAD-reducing hydrogenase small subunit
MSKLKIATIWLDGCSGCHMSFLDMDERLVGILELADLVYSPLVDAKVFPEDVDITLVEGAVSTADDLKKLKKAREHTKLLVALGDCAVTGNVPSMRNTFGRTAVLDTVYIENATIQKQIPREVIPKLLKFSKPIHELVKVDVFLPGCPPSADTIYYALQELVAGRIPEFETVPRFGA